MSIASLEGRVYPDRAYRLCAEKVGEFVAATGDDQDRWSKVAPPGMAAALLFVVAPELLAEVAGPVVHGDQSFAWHRALTIETELAVTGTVERVRERSGSAFVVFSLAVSDGSGPLVDGRSTFLVGAAAEPMAEVAEPPVLTGGGEFSASRADLVRYAAATRDWNPIHWDHEAAVAAGLGGIVVHGLLQSSWLARRAGEARTTERPLASARFRYTAPLRPGQETHLQGEPESDDFELALVAANTVTVSGKFRMAHD